MTKKKVNWTVPLKRNNGAHTFAHSIRITKQLLKTNKILNKILLLGPVK